MDDEYERRLSQVGGKKPKRSSKGNFRSSIYGGGIRRQSQTGGTMLTGGNGVTDGDGWEDSNGAPVKMSSSQQAHAQSAHTKHRRSSITDTGRSIARRASNIIAIPLKALGDMVEANVQSSVIGAANSRAHQVLGVLLSFLPPFFLCVSF